VDTFEGAQCAEESTMARRRRRTFSPEFKVEAVRLVASSDASMATIAQQLGIGRGVLRRWVEAAQPSPRDSVTEDERSELARLRRENLQLKMERDILKKATAFFARQSE
jgi:transposase